MFSKRYKPVLKGKQYAKIAATPDQANICATQLRRGSASARVRKKTQTPSRQVT